MLKTSATPTPLLVLLLLLRVLRVLPVPLLLLLQLQRILKRVDCTETAPGQTLKTASACCLRAAAGGYTGLHFPSGGW